MGGAEACAFCVHTSGRCTRQTTWKAGSDSQQFELQEIHRSRHILPQPIRDYITTVNSTLEFLAQSDAAGPLSQRLKLFQEIRHTFGRTALVLSGGGALGTFHLVCLPLKHACVLAGLHTHHILSPHLPIGELWLGLP